MLSRGLAKVTRIFRERIDSLHTLEAVTNFHLTLEAEDRMNSKHTLTSKLYTRRTGRVSRDN